MFEVLSRARVFITGSSSGLGRELARSFIAEGARVVINGRCQEKVASAASELGADGYVVGDVSSHLDSDRIARDAIHQLGGIDVLVCNVGSGKSARPGEERAPDWDAAISINLFSTIYTVESFKRELEKAAGTILCISSICGLEAVPGAPVTYSVAKAALNAYVRGMAKPFGKKGVRINAIAPGNLYFPGSVWEEKLESQPDLVSEMLDKDVALGVFGEPSDVSSLALYLTSTAAKFVTGGVFVVDGGQVR